MSHLDEQFCFEMYQIPIFDLVSKNNGHHGNCTL